MRVLVVDHGLGEPCGIVDHGRRMVYRLREAGVDAEHVLGPPPMHADAYVFNYRANLMPWAPDMLHALPGVKAAVLHDYEPATLDQRACELLAAGFNRVLVMEPDARPGDRRVFPVGRFLPPRPEPVVLPDDEIRIGSFGFAFPHKGFADVAIAASVLATSVDRPVVYRLHTPEAYFNGAAGAPLIAEGIAAACLIECANGGVGFEHTTDRWGDDELVTWLAGNHVNCLFYANAGQPDSGLSGALDYLLAARRPILVSENKMFRHGRGAVSVLPVNLAHVLGNAPVEQHLVTVLADEYDATDAKRLIAALS